VAARDLLVDVVTVEVVEHLQREQVPMVLLKGQSIAGWLYRDGSSRHYGDTDLLVPPDAERRAKDALAALGFTPSVGTGRPDPGVASRHQWTRSGSVVELHVSLVGVGASAQEVWSTLGATPHEMKIGELRVPILSLPARAFHVALHAAQHGRMERQPLEDLKRALERESIERWAEAAAIAQRLQATPAFAAGLRLTPAGAALATELALPRDSTVDTVRRSESSPPLALGFERLRSEQGLRARGKRVLRHLAPTPDFMRWWSPLARRGRLGLAAAYVWRPLWVAWHLVPSWRAWRRARRATEEPPRR
jgi:hypothetical protein